MAVLPAQGTLARRLKMLTQTGWLAQGKYSLLQLSKSTLAPDVVAALLNVNHAMQDGPAP